MTNLKKITKTIRGLWYRKYYVVLDGRADSVTLSKAIYGHITQKSRSDTDIFVFEANDSRQYAFAMKADFEALRNVKTTFCQLQYNSDHHKIGFRSQQPSVTAMLTAYGCPIDKMVRLSVIPRKTKRGETFYEIQRPM